jgi:hypothetical protein
LSFIFIPKSALELRKVFLTLPLGVPIALVHMGVSCSVTIPAVGQAALPISQLSVETVGEAYSSHCVSFCTVLLKEYVTKPVRGYA